MTRRQNRFNQFQSTLSVRRATPWFSPIVVRDGISIHALRKESDFHAGADRIVLTISIHALRKESDIGLGDNGGMTIAYFNPRSP